MKHYEIALRSLNGGLLVFDADGFRIDKGDMVFYKVDEKGIQQDAWVAASGEWVYVGLVNDEQFSEMKKKKEAK